MPGPAIVPTVSPAIEDAVGPLRARRGHAGNQGEPAGMNGAASVVASTERRMSVNGSSANRKLTKQTARAARRRHHGAAIEVVTEIPRPCDASIFAAAQANNAAAIHDDRASRVIDEKLTANNGAVRSRAGNEVRQCQAEDRAAGSRSASGYAVPARGFTSDAWIPCVFNANLILGKSVGDAIGGTRRSVGADQCDSPITMLGIGLAHQRLLTRQSGSALSSVEPVHARRSRPSRREST